MSESSSDRDLIDGSRVIARQKAAMIINALANDGKPVTMDQIDECLLEDGRTVYQCAHAKRPCNDWREHPRSVSSHQRTHSDTQELKRVQAERKRIADEKAALDEKAAKQFANRSNGQRKAHEVRQMNVKAPLTRDSVDPRTATLVRIDNIRALISQLDEEFDRSCRLVRVELKGLEAEVKKIPVGDPALNELAAALAKLNIKS